MNARFICFLALTVIALLANQLAAQESKNAVAENKAKSKNRSGAQMAVSVPASVPAGSPVALRVEISYTGKDKARISYDRYRDFHAFLAVVDKKNKAVPLTAYGKKTLRPTEIADVLARARGSH